MNFNLYQQLKTEPPQIIKEAVSLIGITEKKGSSNNPVILEWAKEVEKALKVKSLGYTEDNIPWCGLFAAVVCTRANWVEQMPKKPLWARSWVTFGQKSREPSLGDILVFRRKGGGHVGFYVAEDKDHYHVLGGNQNDSVNIVKLLKNRLIEARQPIWRIKKPDSVKPYLITETKEKSKLNPNLA